ncbi:MAG: zf-HC2 domain-containing protein [Candidatus Eisenbacteria bacterium]|nr:zf-HC2 domain-containing protein [Candidatus Eisenbacteria bacterium]
MIGMLRCREVVSLAGDYIERRLRLRRRLAVLLHLAMCRGCRAYIEQLRLTLLALASRPRTAPAADERDALLRAFREGPGRPGV